MLDGYEKKNWAKWESLEHALLKYKKEHGTQMVTQELVKEILL
jgi:hypothetical protein